MYQKVEIIGNLGSDPELKYMPDGNALATFSVATNRKWKNKDGSQGEETVWFRVSAWRKLGEICNEYLSKGRQVFVEGRLVADKETGSPRVWSAKDGTPRASFEITAQEVKFLGGSGDLVGVAQSMGGQKKQAIGENEIPF